MLAVALSISAGAYGMHVFDARALAAEKAERATDGQKHAADLLAISRTALDAQQRAIAAHDTAAARVAAVDSKFTKERMDHENDNRRYRDALAAGTDQLRVTVRNCSPAGADSLSGGAGAASVGDGATAVADLDRATAERAFAVAGDDQREIDKLRALQEYVCTVRPASPGCVR
ncbi:lysis system i-spanin subunit Rz [Burkholderia plantarii]|uniref:lysis system i-spanin subunit Rz n=1 Tax=Burkholderia plantarii TaxID=41899 RepID=UPI000706880F|nr:lysis system i-spanin subunit Rz [Burkholderia plantarii]ALK30824.1 bacteriophage lysis protein [Burkholderia plantarii]GLZ19451.1 hypothetical protein Bpla01_29810 [Burkholderia plantarii]